MSITQCDKQGKNGRDSTNRNYPSICLCSRGGSEGGDEKGGSVASRLVLWPTANSNKVIPGRVICLCRTRTRFPCAIREQSGMTAGMAALQYYYVEMSCWAFTTRSRFYMCFLHERQILRQTTKSYGEWSGLVGLV